MSPELVSVVIPTYNRRHTINFAINSVLTQNYPLLELIVIDDGSTDNTGQQITGYCGGDSRVTYLHQPNAGVCTARNAGIAIARGEFVAMLDSDDAWLPGKLRMQIGILKEHPELSLVATDMAAVDPEREIISKKYLKQFYGTYRYFPRMTDLFEHERTTDEGVRYWTGDIAKALLLGNLIHTSTVVARADRLRAAGPFEQIYHPAEDQDLYFRLCKTGPAALVDSVTTLYMIGGADAESGPSNSRVHSLKALAVMEKHIAEEPELAKSLPAGLIARALSDVCAWAGRAHFQEGLMSDARTYLWRHILTDPDLLINPDLKSLQYLAASFLPWWFLNLLRRSRRKNAVLGGQVCNPQSG